MVSSSFLVTLAISALASAQGSTNYLTQTNSLGVVTGQPPAATIIPGQPAVVTSQPSVASIPALSNGTTTLTFNNHTYTVAVSGSVTSLISLTSTTAGASGSAARSASGSAASGSAQATGAAATGSIAAGALLMAGGVFAAFL